MFLCVCVCPRARVCVFVCACLHVCVSVYIRIYIYVCKLHTDTTPTHIPANTHWRHRANTSHSNRRCNTYENTQHTQESVLVLHIHVIKERRKRWLCMSDCYNKVRTCYLIPRFREYELQPLFINIIKPLVIFSLSYFIS